MGKSKASKNGDTVLHRHLHSRISYLHQAATYLATNTSTSRQFEPETGGGDRQVSEAVMSLPKKGYGQSRHLLNQLRGVSKKSQIRLRKDIKHTICRRCDSLLISGVTSHEEIQNGSKDGGKPWADVFEIKCKTCGTVKRFPVGQQRVQKVKVKRERPSSRETKGKKGALRVGKNEQTTIVKADGN